MRRLLLSCALALPLAAVAFAATAATAATDGRRDAKSVKVAELGFFAGRWVGSANGANVEQLCSTTEPSTMMCMFRAWSSKGTEMLELYTLRDTPNGVEERVRFFEPDLKEEPGEGLTMRLTGVQGAVWTFENPNGNMPKRSTLTKKSDDEFTSHIEFVDGKGRSSFIDASWKRAK